MEINGFQIDKYNQYGLSENVKLSTCPLCSHLRKPENQKVKCATVHWDSGLLICHHCGESVQLHTYKKKTDVKEYKRPIKWNYTSLSDNLVKWFSSRGISQFTLKILKVGESREWMPQVQREQNTVNFNYFENGEIVNIKYRDGAKNFKLFKDAKLIFYNLDSISISEEVVIVEGEIDCLSFVEAGINTVVSTPNGSTLKTVNLEYLDNCIEYFDNKKKIYLALDNDAPGQNVTKELIRRLGAERCFLVDFGDCKDANEYLVKHGKESLKNTVINAKEIPIEGVSSVMNWETEYDKFLLNGMKKGFTIGKKHFDSIFSTYTGQFIVVTGIPSCFDADRLVHTSQGVKKISEIKENDFVLSYNHEKRKNEYQKVVNTSFNTNHNGKMYEIKMKDGTRIKVTDNHKFFTGIEYLQIKDILLSLPNKIKK